MTIMLSVISGLDSPEYRWSLDNYYIIYIILIAYYSVCVIN